MRWLTFLIAAFVIGCGEDEFKNRKAKWHEEGKQAALSGMPPQACPYWDRGMDHEQWKRGWQAGFLERKGKDASRD